MAEGNSKPQPRRRRSSGNPSLPLNLDAGYINDCGTSQGTPSPFVENASADPRPSPALLEFRKKQQSFDIHIEDCEEEDIEVSEDEEMDAAQDKADRPVTPAVPMMQDFGNVVYTESIAPRPIDYLKVNPMQNECLTDVSDADTEEE